MHLSTNDRIDANKPNGGKNNQTMKTKKTNRKESVSKKCKGGDKLPPDHLSQQLYNGNGLVQVRKIESGKGFFFTTDNGCSLRRVEVTAIRVKVDAERDDLCVFVENRSFTKIKDYGCGSVVAVPSQDHYRLGVCISVDLTSIVYLECPDMTVLERLYATNSFSDHLEKRLSSKVFSLAHTGRNSDGCPSKRQKVANSDGVFWLNLVHCPSSMRKAREAIRADCFDPCDRTISYSASGPDVLFKGTLAKKTCLLREARAKLDDFEKVFAGEVKQDRLKGRLCRKQRGDYFLASETDLDQIGYNLCRGPEIGQGSVTRRKLWEFPYVGKNKVGEKMALLTKAKAEKWIADSHGLSTLEYDEKLAEISEGNISLSVVDYTSNSPLWICSVPGTLDGHEKIACESMERLDDGRVILRGTTFGSIRAIFPDSHLLAAGGNLLPKNLTSIDPTILQAVLDCYGSKGSFGDRKRSHCLGTNTYQGPRCSSGTRPNPVCGSSCLASTDYYAGSYKNNHAIVALNPIMTLLANTAATIGRQLHVKHIAFLEKTVDHPGLCMLDSSCCNRIITTGIIGQILSFANTHHVDSDELGGHYSAQYKEALEMENSKKARIYLQSWLDRFKTFDSPTTCGCAYSGNPEEDAVVHQFFSMGGLGCTARLAPGSVHAFFARRFCHNTAAVTLVKNDRVYLRDPRFACFTWGLGIAASKG